MGHKIAIDFGTTNSVVAQWHLEKDAAEVLAVNPISDTTVPEHPPLVPSLLYVDDAKSSAFTIGQAVREQGKDAQKDNRLFRNFKRGIVVTPTPEPRDIDGQHFADRDAGANFLKQILQLMPYKDNEIEQLVLTAPVAAFEGYLAWLNQVIDEIAPEKIRVIDESTAAALGYAVTEPGAVVLVFDFGGGTLDLSLVQLPEHKRKTGGFLTNLLGGGKSVAKNMARVIAKAGRIIGGSDIDQWLVQDVLKRSGVSISELSSNYTSLLTECEAAKIALSTEESADIGFEAVGKIHSVTITREELENLLEENEFYTALRKVVDKVMHLARQRGIFKEDIKYVLMVGGISLMPSVQRTLAQYFTDKAVRADKPFSAVAEGALQLAAGYGLDDYLVHSYGLRYLDDSGSDKHEWDEIISIGSSYPIEKPIEVLLSTAHENQETIEFIIGEIDTEAVSMIEVKYEDGQAVFVANTKDSERRISPMNEFEALKMLAKLEPPVRHGETRLKVYFTVDDRRQLRMTVYDVKKNKVLLEDVAVVTLQ
jgi:molecular chaperone DnaK (HSP70)